MAITGQFEVPGTSDTGVEFTNTQSTELVYTFSVSGFWTPNQSDPNHQGVTSVGFPSLHPGVQDWYNQNWPDMPKYQKYPNNTPFALIAENLKTGAVTEIGKKATIALKPGDKYRFVLNDLSWDYANNGGSITVNWSASELVSKVIVFDGDNDCIILPPIDEDWSNGLTVEAWVYIEDITRNEHIITLGQASLQDSFYLYHWNKTDAKADWKFYVTIGGTQKVEKAVGTTRLSDPKIWTHIAATIKFTGKSATLDARTGECILYINGESVTSANDMFLPFNLRRTKNLIGGYLSSSDTIEGDFLGKLSEIRLWKRPRTKEEIKADMKKRLTGRESDLVAYWPLNDVTVEGSEVKVLDRANGYHGTVKAALLVEDRTLPFF